MRCGEVVCVRVLQVPSSYAFASEAGSVMLAIRAGACVCARLCIYVCVFHQGGGMGFNGRTRSSMLVFVRDSQIPGRDWRKGGWW